MNSFAPLLTAASCMGYEKSAGMTGAFLFFIGKFPDGLILLRGQALPLRVQEHP